MQAFLLDDVLSQLRVALEQNDITSAVTLLEALRAPDQAELFAELHDEDQRALLPAMAPVAAADIVEELDNDEAAELMATLPTNTVIRIVDEMEPDEAADLLGDLQSPQAQAVLAGLEDPHEIRPLLLHPDDSAGGLMTSAFLALRRRMTAADALLAVRTWKPDLETLYALFVVDRYGRLCGVIELPRLLVADDNTLIGALMDPESLSVSAGTDQEEVARIMAHYDLVALPVVDDLGVLVGVITIDDVVDVMEEEATEDIHRLAATEPLDRPYLDTGILTVARKRVGWLMMLFLTGTLTGSVLRLFEHELQVVVALAYFVPLLIGTGGNAGSQTTSTIIRALAVGDIDRRRALRALWHELRVGLLLGLCMAIAAFVRAQMWHTGTAVALTASLAIFAIVVWANSLGSVLPLIVERLGIDPTVVSGPAMSTLVDATGLLIYFGIARLILVMG